MHEFRLSTTKTTPLDLTHINMFFLKFISINIILNFIQTYCNWQRTHQSLYCLETNLFALVPITISSMSYECIQIFAYS